MWNNVFPYLSRRMECIEMRKTLWTLFLGTVLFLVIVGEKNRARNAGAIKVREKGIKMLTAWETCFCNSTWEVNCLCQIHATLFINAYLLQPGSPNTKNMWILRLPQEIRQGRIEHYISPFPLSWWIVQVFEKLRLKAINQPKLYP